MSLGSSRQIALVSCVSVKREEASCASDLYQSQWFKFARAWVEMQRLDWLILSAKHGVLTPEQVVAPYELTLNKMPIAKRREWAQSTFLQLKHHFSEDDTAVFLAGARYREGLAPMLEREGVHVEAPMEGLGIGKQLQWFKNALEQA